MHNASEATDSIIIVKFNLLKLFIHLLNPKKQ